MGREAVLGEATKTKSRGIFMHALLMACVIILGFIYAQKKPFACAAIFGRKAGLTGKVG